ncbi:MAG TPA: T9SS type A sorting domain-containing protein [Fluviicola sp.]|nr:T9SS type A sorting domain-containing protein [Fluviicola sp.]
MKHFLFFAFASLYLHGFSQTRASQCYYGTCLINFEAIPFLMIATNAAECRESPASICGEDGQLLFYSNGGPSPTSPAINGVWSADGSFMENGEIMDSAGCVSTFQGACIIPKPSLNRVESSEYYLFTKDCIESSASNINSNSGLSLAVIDMNANNGLGTVVSKYQTIVPYQVVSSHSTAYEPLSIIGHANGVDYWLFSYTKDSLYRLPVTTTGIGSPTLLFPSGGRILFSPSKTNALFGNKYYSFDAQTGDLTFITEFISSHKYAFSSDGTKLYTLKDGILAQYDCLASDLIASKIIISSSINSTNNQLFLADNSRIYIAGSEKTYIDAQIVCPNNPGVSCGYDPTDLSLFGGLTGSNGFTNIPAHFLYKEAANCNLGLETQTESQLFSVFQSDQLLTVSSILPDKCSLRLFESSGLLIQTIYFSESTIIDKEGLAKGIYFIVLETPVGIQTTEKVCIH